MRVCQKTQHRTLHETIDKSPHPSFCCRPCSLDELNEQQDTSAAAPPQCFTSVVRNASVVHRTRVGKSVNLPLSGAALTWRSATAVVACAPATIEATPIISPSQNSMPQAIGKWSCASIHASIDAAALEADSGNDDNIGNEYSFFGNLANPDPKRSITKEYRWQLYFAICWLKEVPTDLSEDQKGQGFQQGIDPGEEGYFGQRPPPPSKQCKRGLTFGLKLWRSKGSGHLMHCWVHLHHCLPYLPPPGEASGKGRTCFYWLQDHCACTHVQLLHHQDQFSWSCPPIAEQGCSNQSPTAAAEAEVNKATSTKLPIGCKQCMHFMSVQLKRISLSPNHLPQTSAFPNARRPDWSHTWPAHPADCTADDKQHRCARLCSNTYPNLRVTHRANNTRRNCWVFSFHSQYDCKLKHPTVVVPRLTDLHPPRRWAVFSVGWIELQPKLIPVNPKPPWCPMNPKQPRPGPIKTTMIQIVLCELLIGNGRRYLHDIAQFSQSFTHIFLQEYPCIIRFVCNECDALDTCCLRPNELEYHKQQEVLPC
jgi:hypothetical protein